MRIECTYCGHRDFSEFRFRREISDPDTMPDELDKSDAEAIHIRANQAGRQSELWQHVFGCRTWLVVNRDTRTNTIFGVAPVRKTK